SVLDWVHSDSRKLPIGAVLAFVVASITRADEFWALGILLAAIFVGVTIFGAPRKREGLRAGVILGIISTTCLLCQQLNRSYYDQDIRWHDFFPYQPPYVAMVDDHRVNYDLAHHAIFEKAGWSRNDLTLFEAFFAV